MAAITMDIRHWCRHRATILITLFVIFLSITINRTTANDDQLQRRDIASITASELNRNRNLRQTYEGNPFEYHEILPKHSFNYNGDNDVGLERNSTDNRKPAFNSCENYSPSVKEEQPSNTFVIRVSATDPDEFDTITYSFEKSVNERAKFRINAKTGEIVTSYTFDRDEPIREKEVRVFLFLTCRFI